MKKFLMIILSAALLVTACACGQSPDAGKKEETMEPLYPEKENVIADRQSYTAGEIQFPASLWQTPKFTRAEEYDRDDHGAQGYFIESVPYHGAPTQVFVYAGFPEGASAEQPVPAVVCVHGGGGTAFPDWVAYWTDKGYAAVSVDTEGHVPTKTANVYEGVAAEESPKYHGPENSHFSDGNKKIEEQWCYHAVAATIAANSFLRSFPQVDNSKIGLTGISYGSVVVTDAACYDDRFVFCAPVYGCASLRGTSGIFGSIYENNPRSAALWDDVEPLKVCRTPFLFVNWNEDPYFAIDATSRCVAAAPYAEEVLIDKLMHGHLQGMQVPEIYTFAQQICRGEKDCLPQIVSSPSFENPKLIFDDKRSEVIYATLYTTNDSAIGEKTVWNSVLLVPEGNEFTFELEREVTAFYLTLNDQYGVRSTSVLVQKNA